MDRHYQHLTQHRLQRELSHLSSKKTSLIRLSSVKQANSTYQIIICQASKQHLSDYHLSSKQTALIRLSSVKQANSTYQIIICQASKQHLSDYHLSSKQTALIRLSSVKQANITYQIIICQASKHHLSDYRVHWLHFLPPSVANKPGFSHNPFTWHPLQDSKKGYAIKIVLFNLM